MPKMVWMMMMPGQRREQADRGQPDDQRIDHHLVGHEGAEDEEAEEQFGALVLPEASARSR